METKKCAHCGKWFSLDYFQWKIKAKRKRMEMCRDCKSKKERLHRATEHGTAKRQEYNSRYYKNYSHRRPAYQAVQKAIKDGVLIIQSCEICGDSDTEAHHPDYSKYLEVKWLCGVHHSEEHRFRKSLDWVDKHYGEALKRLADGVP